jgi:hypothetical protein
MERRQDCYYELSEKSRRIMAPYLLALSLIILLGFGVELTKQNHWDGQLLLGKNSYVVSLNAILWILILAVFMAFGGLRYQVGTDFESYCTIFRNISEDWYLQLYDGTERGYVWLNRIVSLYTEDPQWIIFITNGFISVLGVLAIQKFSRFVPFSLYIFFTTIYFQGFNLIRQGMACALIFLAFGYAREHRYVIAYGLILAASLFHKSSLVVIPVMLLMQIPFHQVWYFIYFAGSSLAFLLKEQINAVLLRIYPSAAATSTSYLYEDFSPVQVILCLIYVILCMKYYKPLREKNKGNILYINFAVFLLGAYTCFYWIPMWGRLQLYFVGFYGLIVPEILDCEKNRMIRVLYYAVIWGILAFFFIVPVLISGTWGWPYQTIWSR